MKRNSVVGRWGLAATAFGGIVTAWYLTSLHVQSQVGETVGGGLCNVDGFINCGAAAGSEYSTLLGIPIAAIGVAFYVAMLLLTFIGDRGADAAAKAGGAGGEASSGGGKGSRKKGSKGGKRAASSKAGAPAGPHPFGPSALAVTLFGLSVLFSGYLAVISLAVLGSLCPFCVMLYVINILGLVAATAWHGAAPHRVLLAQLREPKRILEARSPLGTAVVFGAALLVSNNMVDANIELERAERIRQEVSRLAAGELVPETVYRADHSPGKGPVDAPVHIVEFSNFACPHCRQLAATLNRVGEEYGDKVRIEYRHFPFAHQEGAQRAARAAVCANEQGQFWPMHDALFANLGSNDQTDVLRYGEQIGLDVGALASCLDSTETRRVVSTDVAVGGGLDIQGTPMMFINGHRVGGAQPFDSIKRLIDRLLEEQQQQG